MLKLIIGIITLGSDEFILRDQASKYLDSIQGYIVCKYILIYNPDPEVQYRASIITQKYNIKIEIFIYKYWKKLWFDYYFGHIHSSIPDERILYDVQKAFDNKSQWPFEIRKVAMEKGLAETNGYVSWLTQGTIITPDYVNIDRHRKTWLKPNQR